MGRDVRLVGANPVGMPGRILDLDDRPPAPPAPGPPESLPLEAGELEFVHGDQMVRIVTTVRSRYISFHKILAKADTVPDHSPAYSPFDLHDYEHELVGWPQASLGVPWNELSRAVRCVYIDGEPRKIELSDDARQAVDVYDYLRRRGASKQVAREAQAESLASTYRYIQRCYIEDWCPWIAECRYLGEEGRHDGFSLAGDDGRQACYEACLEAAQDVACALEERGFVVVDKPTFPGYDRRASLLEKIARNLGFHTLEGYRTWLARDSTPAS